MRTTFTLLHNHLPYRPGGFFNLTKINVSDLSSALSQGADTPSMLLLPLRLLLIRFNYGSDVYQATINTSKVRLYEESIVYTNLKIKVMVGFNGIDRFGFGV